MEDKDLLQIAFNKAWQHFVVEKHGPSFGDGDHETGGCLYRLGLEGRSPIRCAIGLLIADEHYSRKLEHKAVGNFAVWDALIKSGFIPEQWTNAFDHEELVDKLNRLQSCHDEAAIAAGPSNDDFTRIVEEKLTKLAYTEKLEVPQ